ncbi:MAG: tetratricopeptide repeat protein, partial [Bacteroidetes bacterium]|nr:tetratricopeptide repeat protein [Bacteroidota bacterium]
MKSHSEALYQQALADFKIEEYENALKHAYSAFESGGEELQLWILLASILRRMDRFTDALGWIEKVIKRDSTYRSPDLESKDGNSLYVFGYILDALHRYEEALTAYDRAIE